VAKIADETVRGYYAQDMKTKIYHEIGRGAAWQKTKFEGTSSYKRKNERATISLVGTVRTNLDDLVAEYVISALICYPQLIEEYEEKLLDFQIKSDRLRRLYEYLLELAHEGVEIETSEALQHILCDKGFDEELKNRVDLKMLFKQCPDIMLMRKNLDDRIVEVQLRQLEMDIRECMRQMQTGDSFSEETFSRYESLKKEREALLASQNDD